MEKRRKWKLPGLLYADDFVTCGESEKDLRVMVGRIVELCRRRGLKVNANKSKVMVMNREEGLECEVHVDWGSFRTFIRIQIFGMCFGRSRYKWGRM